MNTRPGIFDNWTDFWGMMLVAVPIGCIGWLVIGMIIFLIWVLIAAV
jgi:hypothetical protein